MIPLPTAVNAHSEKIAQAIKLLPEHQLDMWITISRETMHGKDPALSLIYSGDTVWLSAFIITRDGANIALVGNHDADGIRQREEFATILSYDEDFRQPFLEILNQFKPERIGLNFSLENPAADGLSYGLWLKLQSLLQDTPYIHRIYSAASLIGQLRGIKTPGEIDKIITSIDCAQEIITDVGHRLTPGLSELDISMLFKKGMKIREVSAAWSADGCPAVNCGPESRVGHSQPSPDSILHQGHIVHIDFGVIKDNYASDLQRVWYLPKEGEDSVPPEVAKAFYVVRQAIGKSAAFIKPGVLGYEVDHIARQMIIDAGYPEYKHALGHEVGQKAHDGGIILGPKWPRYEGTNNIPLQSGNVFTLELGVPTSAGYLGLEEMILVEDDGCRFLSKPQEDIWIIK